jgi:hypothetical protein
VGLPIVDGSLTGESAITVSTSANKGVDWSDPVDVTRDFDPNGLVFNDKQSITANPYRPGHAYVTWIQGNLPGENISFPKLAHAFSYRGQPMISRTTDAGAHWSAPQPMTNANEYAQGNQIVVLPDGSLVDVQAVLFKGSGIQRNPRNTSAAGIPTDVYIRHSGDRGATWSTPQRVKSFDLANAPVARGYFVGDYQGLEARGARGLIAFFGVAGSRRETADVYSVQLAR